ncbi:hypothetical protein [Massilia sp. erpn]|uniref:hypothetical protein n=1 Tax=Massilia sp. erpn TaxID=2738142 RepID=UPI0021074681|nr:hypothetical protein [Massilia sp. erpn]UTY58720.1 hypothetical protein HPQ68_16910 [Massilia sp. erpn]
MNGLIALTVLFCLICGPLAGWINYRHHGKFEPGNEWAYYAKLKREGHRDGKIMMALTYLGIALIIATLAFGYIALLRA